MGRKRKKEEGTQQNPLKKWSDEVKNEWAEFCEWANKNGYNSYLSHIHTEFSELAYIENTTVISTVDRLANLVDMLDTERITNLVDTLDHESTNKSKYTYNHTEKDRPTKKWYAIRVYFIFCSNRKFGELSKIANSTVYSLWRIGPCTEAVSKALTGEVLGEQLLKTLKKGEDMNDRLLVAFMRHRWKVISRWKTNKHRVIENVTEAIMPNTNTGNSIKADTDRKNAFIQLRDSVAEAASKLRESLLEAKGIKGSRIDQILLQLISLKVPRQADSTYLEDVWDWFNKESERAILHYIAELLAELYINIVSWDGVTCILPRIMGDTEQSDWLTVLIAAPFTRILSDNGMTEFISSGRDDVYRYRTKATTKLLQSGIAWVDTTRAFFHFPIKKMPMNIRVLADPAEARTMYARIWTSEDSKRLLRDFLEIAAKEQISHYKMSVGEKSDHHTYFDSTADDRAYLIDLKFILDSASEVTNVDKRIVNRLVKLLVNCSIDYIYNGTLQQAMDANSILLSLCTDYFGQVASALRRREESERHEKKIDYTIFLQFPNHLKELIVKKEAKYQELVQYYYSYMHKCFSETLKLAFRHSIESLDVEITLCYIQTLTANWDARRKTTDIDVLLMDFLRPCKTALEKCREDICAGNQELFAEKFKDSIDIYTSSRDSVLCTLKDDDQRKNYEIIFQLQAETESEDIAQQKKLSDWATGILRTQAVKQVRPTLDSCRPDRKNIYAQCFLDDLDSVTIAAVYKGETDLAETKLMKVLMEAKNVVLTLPMLVDSKLMRSLAKSPEFLWAMRSGLINVSPYGNTLNLHDSLCSYAAGQMLRTYEMPGNAFKWSSLAPKLDSDKKAREAAAKYLLGKDSAPEQFRTELEEFREALILLDENIPYESRVMFYQTGAVPQLSQKLKEKYDVFRNKVEYHSICNTHDRIVQTIQKKDYVRSDYLNALKNLQAQNDCDPESLVTVGQILNDVYKRMLANQCPNVISSFPYTESDALLVQIQQDTNAPDNCVVTQESVIPTSDPESKTWRDVMEYRMELAEYVARDPNMPLEKIKEKLNVDLATKKINDEKLLYVTKIKLRTKDNTSYQVEITPKRGITHVETKGGTR